MFALIIGQENVVASEKTRNGWNKPHVFLAYSREGSKQSCMYYCSLSKCAINQYLRLLEASWRSVDIRTPQ